MLGLCHRGFLILRVQSFDFSACFPHSSPPPERTRDPAWTMALYLATRAMRAPVSRSTVRLMATRPPKAPSQPSSSSNQPASSPIPNEEPAAPNRSSLPSLDFDPASIPGPASGGRTGARSAEGSLSSIERKKRLLSRLGLGVLAIGLGATYVYMGREWEESEAPLKRDVRAWRRAHSVR